LKTSDLNKTALGLAKKEYREEYPRPGNGPMKPKTYPFKKYLDKQKD